jgi:tRNA(Ile)-lysidine synthetase-like protein
MQLSGGVEVVRRRGEFVLRRSPRHTSAWRSRELEPAVALPTAAGATGVVVGRWRFDAGVHEAGGEPGATIESPWTLWLPAGAAAAVRPWRPGDRMAAPGTGAARRVKRYFGDAGVAGVDRAGWPVVLVGGEIVWIPGVRRAHAAPAPSGRPGVWLTCRTVREPSNR